MNDIKNISTLKAGVIGLGNIGSVSGIDNGLVLNHASAYMRSDQTELICGCSPDRKDRERFENFFGRTSYSSVEDLLKNDLDVISVTTPTNMHFSHVMQCLSAGVGSIFLEKPPTSNIDELLELISKAEKVDARILVNYMRRYSNTYRRLKDFIDKKSFGDVCNIMATYSNGLETNGSHMIDIVLYLISGPCDYSIEYVNDNNSNNPSFVINTGNCSNPIIFNGVDLEYHNLDVVITFENARISVFHGGMSPFIELKKEHENFPGYYRLDWSSDIQLPKIDIEDCFDKALVDLLVTKDTSPVSSLNTAFETQKILNDIRSYL